MARKVPTTPSLPISLPAAVSPLRNALFSVLAEIANRLNSALPEDGTEAMTAPLPLKSYTVAGVPAAALYTGAIIYVSNEAGGAVPAFSDGTNWRRMTDRAVIS